MATMALLMIILMLALIITPWISAMLVRRSQEDTRPHRTDLMAGDEGEDDWSLVGNRTMIR